MSEDGALKASGVGSLSDSRGKENESARDQFDAAWRVGRQPSIERYLQTCQESHREALFRDLLEIEIEYRRRAGDTMNSADYHERFPDFIAVIDQILDDPGLPRPVAMETTADALPTTGEAVGITLGRYKLLQELGTGGFGVVYLAEQQKPVRRRVALKIIKLGMDTKQVVARFEAERQALALMDHPHIATVLDAGATHTGRPYFVMELVKGIPITKYCDEHNVSLNDRLKLFLQVCAAVQHAHQKGIIHRDLKPSNVLVELVDNRPSPKVIDFGIAKATDQRLTEQTMYTELGQFIGTPAYMSPEQTEVQVLDIDTRSDIYSLGVLLYELLTGTTPFDIQKMAGEGAGFDAIKKVIRDVEPSKPSTKLSTLGKDVSTVAKRRGVEPAKLTSILRGDLDWIVMKALEKDRSRRYETASAFAEDVRRFLVNEVVEARPPSRRYRLAKYVRRNKGLVASLAAIAAVLIVGIVGTTLGLIAARDQQAKATAEADRKQKVVDAFVAAFRSPDPNNEGVTSSMTARQVLEQAHATIIGDVELRHDPLAKATLLDAIGSSLHALGAYGEAISAHEESRDLRAARLGMNHRDTLASTVNLADSFLLAGRLNEAFDLFERAIAATRTNLGPEDPLTLTAQGRLAATYGFLGRLEDAVELHKSVYDQFQKSLGKNNPATLSAQNDLAQAYISVGRQNDAIPILEELCELYEQGRGADHPATIAAVNNLANAYLQAGQLQQAISQFERAVTLSRSKLGEDHPDTAVRLGNLGVAYLHASRWQEALPYLEKSLQIRRASLGPDHQDTWTGASNLAAAYWNVGRHDEAQALEKDILESRKAKLGADHPDTLASLQNYAEMCRRLGKLADATQMGEEAVQLMTAKLGRSHPNTLTAMNTLAAIYQEDDRFEDALALGQETLTLSQSTLGETHQETLRRMHNLAVSHQRAGQLEKAIPLSTKAVELLGSHLGVDHYLTLAATRSLASMYIDQDNVDTALPILEDVLKRMESAIGADHLDTLKCKAHIAECYHAQGRVDEARSTLDATLIVAKAQLGEEHPFTQSLQKSMASWEAKNSSSL